jgi:hypothetical protein
MEDCHFLGLFMRAARAAIPGRDLSLELPERIIRCIYGWFFRLLRSQLQMEFSS